MGGGSKRNGEAGADCFGSASPLSPKGRAEREPKSKIEESVKSNLEKLERLILKRFSKKTLFALLLCFVAFVGAVGAYAYMLNNQTSVELSKMDVSNGLILKIDKTVYKPGENVTITFTNNSNETVAFPDYRWFIIKDSEGHSVWPGGWLPAILRVPAGESLTYPWPQKDPYYKQIPPGIYTVDVTVRTADLTEIVDLRVTFEIVG